MKEVSLLKWAEKHFDPIPNIAYLRNLARTNQIEPKPRKLGKMWYVKENAEFIGPQNHLASIDPSIIDDPVVANILGV